MALSSEEDFREANSAGNANKSNIFLTNGLFARYLCMLADLWKSKGGWAFALSHTYTITFIPYSQIAGFGFIFISMYCSPSVRCCYLYQPCIKLSIWCPLLLCAQCPPQYVSEYRRYGNFCFNFNAFLIWTVTVRGVTERCRLPWRTNSALVCREGFLFLPCNN